MKYKTTNIIKHHKYNNMLKLKSFIHLDKICWEWLSSNPNAIHLLEQNPNKIYMLYNY